jgi:predicted XRE-type DNA-binding protein
MIMSGKEYLELCLSNNEQMSQHQKIKETNILEQSVKDQETIEGIMAFKENLEVLQQKRLTIRKSIKKSLLIECICKLYDRALGSLPISEESKAIKTNLVSKFVEEQCTETLLAKFKTTSYVLSEFARVIEDYNKVLVEQLDGEEDVNQFTIEDELKDDFYNELDTDDIEAVAAAIRHRVSNAIDEFIDSNVSDQATIKELLQQSQDKVNSAKTEELKEFYDIDCKRKISDVRNRRKKNILESMVYTLSESAMKNETIKEKYAKGNALDMDRIVESCQVMYTFLETLNTAKIIKVDENYVEKLLKNLKA